MITIIYKRTYTYILHVQLLKYTVLPCYFILNFKNSKTNKIQIVQSKVLRLIPNTPPFISNNTLHKT